MMKIILLILLSLCALLNADQLRYKPRGPPLRRRSPPPPPPHRQFAKKWHQAPVKPLGMLQGAQPFSYRGPPVRQKPQKINHNVNNAPVLMAMPLQLHNMPQRPPTRGFWKNPLNVPEVVYKPQSPPQPVEKQKPFRSAPSLPLPEYDYHIQTNQIPHSHINPIKQIGEKGPIHTIPAPNLSLKDKPPVINEVRSEYPKHVPQQEVSFQYGNIAHEIRGDLGFGQKIPQSTHVTIQKSHEYQVTEPPEHNQKLLRAQQEHQRQIQLQIQKQIEQMQKQSAQQDQPQQIVLTSDIPVADQHSNQEGALSPKDLYQLVSAAYPQPQQTQQQDHVEFFQPDAGFAEQYAPEPSAENQEKLAFRPEYQSFNYDEQAHQKSQSKKVSATYNFGSEADEEEPELVRNYFDSRSDVGDNRIEPDEKIAGVYYASLPNQEAAERLAQLQTAGKVNSGLMKLAQGQREPITILIPDDEEGADEAKIEDKKDVDEKYGEYDEEEDNAKSEEGSEFGHRIRSKKRAE
ncbi:unnamed protein product [Phyllotreta striolata]|uniref:Uncharacterized protein n=1 Tax=Phyllotreta striolata TaxID=444603 RepID=A0A9N9XU23_PHYSR|nr:unnamed protein product [Phyllotreta striolata]